MPGNTTRKTSDKPIKAKVKPLKQKKRRGKGSKTATEAFNTYKKVKIKLPSLRRKKKTASPENPDAVAPLKRSVLVGIGLAKAPERAVGKELDARNIDDKMDTQKNREHGYVNHNDDPADSEFLIREKELDEVAVYAKKRKKKDNTLLYLIITGAVTIAFLYFKKKK